METKTTVKNDSIFDSKEAYLAFRAHWRKLFADGIHKPVKETYKVVNYDGKTNKWSNGEGHHMRSPLMAWHHLVFLLAIGRDPNIAFGKHHRNKYIDRIPLYWELKQSEENFAMFGDTLSEPQKKALMLMVKEFRENLADR